MKVKIFSLGCRLNQYEIESVATALKQAGVFLTEDEAEADFCVVNSCVVTGKSEAKTRNLVQRAQKSQKTIVTGCFAKVLKKDKQTLFLPNDYKHLIPQAILHWDSFHSLDELEGSRFKYLPPVDASTTRVNVKIQDGCDSFCSYCVIPLVRGKPQSRDLEDVLKEMKTLIEKGYQELVLTGITIGKYESSQVDLAGLMDAALNLEGRFRLHLSSLDPNLISEKLLSLLTHPKMVRHLHLSLQSGSNAVLKNMNRRYTREQYLDLVSRIRQRDPFFNLTTDVITGFPGETEDQHKETLDLIERARFSHVHTFRYSGRPMTAAASFPNQVPEAVKKRRSGEVMEKAAATGKNFLSLFHEKAGWFLGEREISSGVSGHTDYYLPLSISRGGAVNQMILIQYQYDQASGVLKGTAL